MRNPAFGVTRGGWVGEGPVGSVAMMDAPVSPERARRRILPMAASQPPGAPDAPSAPSAQPAGSTGVLEREETRQQAEPGDHERYAHYVRKDKIVASAVSGQPVVALCGKVWTPSRDPSRYPVCPACKAIYESLRGGGGGEDESSGSGRGSSGDAGAR